MPQQLDTAIAETTTNQWRATPDARTNWKHASDPIYQMGENIKTIYE